MQALVVGKCGNEEFAGELVLRVFVVQLPNTLFDAFAADTIRRRVECADYNALTPVAFALFIYCRWWCSNA